jgi:CRP/FNR family transcriptional regulator, cyclic AMP receptor protein
MHVGHVWTASWQELSDVSAALVGCGHVSGLLMRQVWPLALMLCADRVPNKNAHFRSGALTLGFSRSSEQPPLSYGACNTFGLAGKNLLSGDTKGVGPAIFAALRISIGTKEGHMGKSANASFDPQDFLAKVGLGKTISTYRKDQIVFAQGEVADTIFYIQKGRVKVVVLSDQGKEAVVGILEPGQFFGEGCLNGHSLRISTTTAMEECVITSIMKTAMLAALHSEPKFSELFMAYLLTRNSRIEEDLIDQLFNSSEKRLARLLLLLAHFGKEGSPKPIDIDVSQETLAEMIGTTRSRVSFFMNKFRKLGLISYNGKIEVHNSMLNAVLHDKPEIKRDEETSSV